MANMLKPVFTVDIICPICGVAWTKPIYADIRNDDAAMRLVSKPTCCSPACRELSWSKYYTFPERKE